MINVEFTYPPNEPDASKTLSIVGELQLTTVDWVKVKKIQGSGAR